MQSPRPGDASRRRSRSRSRSRELPREHSRAQLVARQEHSPERERSLRQDRGASASAAGSNDREETGVQVLERNPPRESASAMVVRVVPSECFCCASDRPVLRQRALAQRLRAGECKGCGVQFHAEALVAHEAECILAAAAAEASAVLEFSQRRRLALAQQPPQAGAVWTHLNVEAIRARSDAAKPSLLHRFQQHGYDEHHMRQVLTYMRTQAPILIHCQLRSAGLMCSSGHIRNEFELRPERAPWPDQRASAELRLFGLPNDPSFPAELRPRYGALNLRKDPDGVWAATCYGRSWWQVRDHLRPLATICYGDSFHQHGAPSNCIGTLEHCAHVLTRMSYTELALLIQVALGENKWLHCPVRDKGGQDEFPRPSYMEVQLHIPLRLAADMQKMFLSMSEHGNFTPVSEDEADTIVWQVVPFCHKHSIDVGCKDDDQVCSVLLRISQVLHRRYSYSEGCLRDSQSTVQAHRRASSE